MTPKPKRVVPDTHLVVLRGGPPEWDGTVAKVCDVPGQLERWCHGSGLAYVWGPTEETAQVEVDREVRAGTVRETKVAVVYRALGYRCDIPHPQTSTPEGRPVRTEDVPQAVADGQLEVTDS